MTGDGKMELATVGHKSDNSKGVVNVWTVEKDGAFNKRSRVGNGKCFYHVSAGHYDADKNMDLAVADRCTGELHTLTNQGNGKFSFEKSASVGAANCISPNWSASAMRSSDFDGDGHDDWAIGQDCNANGRFYVAFGDGNGGIDDAREVKAGKFQSHYTHAISIGDWDDDNRDDLYLWSDSSSNPLQVAH